MKNLLRLLLTSCLLLALAACDKKPDTEPSANAKAEGDSETVLRILAGSELKDMAPLLQEYGRNNKLSIEMEYSGTLDAIDKLKDANHYDAVWLSNGKYLQMLPQMKGVIKSSEKTMFSPVVLGVKPEVAVRLGWKSGQTSWKDVLQAAKQGKFRFGMTNPAGSNTGFVALVGLAAELSGKGDALEEKDIPVEQLKDFFAAQSLTAGSSGALAEIFANNPARVDGMINYDSVIRSLAAQGQALEVIVPKEGVITADYPLMLLSQSKQQAAYQQLVNWLRSDPVQQKIASTTNRTPLKGSGKDEVVNELPFPASLAVVDAILQGFMDSYSRPAASYFVLDVSGSMAGTRMTKLKEAMLSLANGDGSTSGRFALLRAREEIHLTPFSGNAFPAQTFKLGTDRQKNQEILNDLSRAVNQLKADGGTAIFSAVASVYPQAQEEMRKEVRSVSIVLLTDGQNTNGMKLDDFKDFIAKSGAPKVPVYAIMYGEANQAEMDDLTRSTGGRVFDARKVKLTQVMKDIRNYQ